MEEQPMATDEPVLEARGLAKRYGRGVWALGGIDLALSAGGITALVGPNAAGKSTLMRTWVGFERPTRGQARVAGLDPWRQRSAVLARVGYVPQSPSLYLGLSVEDHLAMAALLRPGFDREGARHRLGQLAIPPSADARQLSGGQQAQVALALVLGTHADLLLLDEPLASLDPLARREFLHVLTDGVRASGATAVLSSHIVTDVEQSCDRLIVLGVGRVLLHDAIAGALASHAVVEPGDDVAATGAAVAAFPGPDGRRLTLVRCEGEVPKTGARIATLDEIVMGYLASARPASADLEVAA
jgi:ABC-2 type transport system ATP-binding protein